MKDFVLIKNQRTLKILESYLPITALILLSALVVFRYSPLIQPLPGLDASVFLYIAKMMNAGLVPYRDIWDHKTPGIYFIAYLGLTLGYPWGTYMLQFLLFIAGAILSLIILREFVDVRWAFWGTALWVVGLSLVTNGPLFPEVIAIPFVLLYLLIFWRLASGKGNRYLSIALLGLLAAALFLLKPTLLGVVAASVAFYLFNIRNDFFRKMSNLTWIGFISLLVISLPMFWLLKNNALQSFWDCVVTFNRFYTSHSISDRVKVFTNGIVLMSPTSTLLGGFAMLWVNFREILIKDDQNNYAFERLMCIWLIVEIIVCLLPGGELGQYYVLWLVSSSMLTAFLLQRISKKFSLSQVANGIVIAGLILPTLTLGYQLAIEPLRNDISSVNNAKEIELYLSESEIKPSDKIFVYKGSPIFYLMVGNLPPTRFIYQYPLTVAGYESETLFKELTAEVENSRPLIILEANNSVDLPSLYGMQSDLSKSPSLNQFIAWVRANYYLSKTIGDNEWFIWKLKGR